MDKDQATEWGEESGPPTTRCAANSDMPLDPHQQQGNSTQTPHPANIQPSPGTRLLPVSQSSPTGPTPRANPFPEVTDLTCRLPLPTLVYRQVAVHLGDLLRISVRPDTKFVRPLSSFHGSTAIQSDPARTAGLFGLKTNQFPLSARGDSRDPGPYTEQKTLPGTAADFPEFSHLTV